MAEIMKDPDFANMSDSDGDDLPLFGEKDSEESDENDTEEDEEKEKKREVKQIVSNLSNARNEDC